MALKEEVWLIAILAGIITLIGLFTPYIWLHIQWVMTLGIWSWGLVYYTPGTGIKFTVNILVTGILIIVGTILILISCFKAKKRENFKAMSAVWLVGGILTLIGTLIPLAHPVCIYIWHDPFGTVCVYNIRYYSFGFYLPLFGGILAILAGIAGSVAKKNH